MKIPVFIALNLMLVFLTHAMLHPSLSLCEGIPTNGNYDARMEQMPIPDLQWKGEQKPVYTLLAKSEPGKAPASSTGEKSYFDMTEAEKQKFIADAINNPLSYLWLGFIQNDMTWYDGDLLDDLNEDAKIENTTTIEPVMSFQLTDEWRTIFRPIIPIRSFTTVDNVDVSLGGGVLGIDGVDFERKTGLGDIVLWTAFSNHYEPPFVWGFGPTVMMPTASEDQLGTGKWSAGPVALAFSLTEKWIIGGVFQHWWSFAGDDDLEVDTTFGSVEVERPDVNLTNFQYYIQYRLTPETSIGCAPNITYNWEADQLNLPIGLGINTMVKIGSMPMKIGFEPQYYVEQSDDFGPRWNFRVYMIPVLPAPVWSREPLFN